MGGLGRMGSFLNRGSSSTTSQTTGPSSSMENVASTNHSHNGVSSQQRDGQPKFAQTQYQYPNPDQLTAEAVASLPHPGQSGPCSFSFSPGSRYLSFLSTTHCNNPQIHNNRKTSRFKNATSNTNVQLPTLKISAANSFNERKLCAIDMISFNEETSPSVENMDPNFVSLSHVFPLLDSSNLEVAESGDSQLSLEERLRRERQRLHATGVTQFSFSAIHQPSAQSKDNAMLYKTSVNDSKAKLSNGSTFTLTSSKGTTEVLLDHFQNEESGDRMEVDNFQYALDGKVTKTNKRISGDNQNSSIMKNIKIDNYDGAQSFSSINEDDNFRILIPLRGNIYIQDGVGASLRLIYDKRISFNNSFSTNNDKINGVGIDKRNFNHRSMHKTRKSGSVLGRDNSAIDPQLSPDGKMVAFVIAGEIFVVDASLPRKPENILKKANNSTSFLLPTPVRVTFGAYDDIGGFDSNGEYVSFITHGLADFVAQEEMDRYRGFWWNNSSDGIVFARVDETDVPPYRICHQGRDDTGSSTYEDHRYPFAGKKNPKVTLGFISVDYNTILRGNLGQAKRHWHLSVNWFKAPRNADEYLARVCFLPYGCVCAQWENREQTTLVLVRINPQTGESTPLLTETSDVWINLHHMLHILPSPIPPETSKDKKLPEGSFSFIFASERTKYCHLYLYTYIGGSNREAVMVRAISAGNWIVEDIVGVDMDRNLVFVTGTFDSPLEKHLYSLPLIDDLNRNKSKDIENDNANSSGRLRIKAVIHSLTGSVDTNSILPPDPCRLTDSCGMHSIIMDRYCKFAVDISSDLQRPTSMKVYAVENTLRLLFVLHDVSAHNTKLVTNGSNYAPPELISFKTSDGLEDLHAALYLPDPKIHGPGPYPLISSVYGGPHVQRVNRSWSQSADMRAQRLRSLGFAIVKCDNRGSSRRGLSFESCIHRRLGRLEVLDQITAVRQLVLMGIADSSRVGIYGWSYGGYLAAMCLFRAPDVFHAAVAGAPVTSWDGYDTHYTERYMGMPQKNLEGYDESALFKHVDNMTGHLMIVHGLIDENVHFRHTARLINRLIAAGKIYDLLMFPDERHSPRRLRDRIYMEQRISDFFMKHLGDRLRRNGRDSSIVRPMAGLL